MRLIARNVLLAYARAHPETAVPLERWYRLVKAANCASMDDIRQVAPTAKVVNRERARFEVAGGNYRMIAAFDFHQRRANRKSGALNSSKYAARTHRDDQW
jgi:mRNA interferase HigB